MSVIDALQYNPFCMFLTAQFHDLCFEFFMSKDVIKFLCKSASKILFYAKMVKGRELNVTHELAISKLVQGKTLHVNGKPS